MSIIYHWAWNQLHLYIEQSFLFLNYRCFHVIKTIGVSRLLIVAPASFKLIAVKLRASRFSTECLAVNHMIISTSQETAKYWIYSLDSSFRRENFRERVRYVYSHAYASITLELLLQKWIQSVIIQHSRLITFYWVINL